jgi:hypothetical protein
MFEREVVDHSYLGECMLDPTFEKKNHFMTEITEAIGIEIETDLNTPVQTSQSCCAVYSEETISKS